MCQKVLGECVGESLGDVPDFRLDAYLEALLYFSLDILCQTSDVLTCGFTISID